MRRADGKIDENDAVAVRFNDPSEIGKGKKYRGGIIVRVNAIAGSDASAASAAKITERLSSLRIPSGETLPCGSFRYVSSRSAEAKLSFEEPSAVESHLRSTRRSSGTVTR